MKNIKTLNEYGGSEWSVITAAKNYLYIDMGKFRDKLKDKKHLKAFDKAKKAFWDVVGPAAEEHSEMYESGKQVECPKCGGEGCSHCDDKGYHINEEDYKYKKYVSKAFKEIKDAVFNFRNAMGIKQLTNKDMKLKKKFDALHTSIFDLEKEMKSDGLTEGKLTEDNNTQYSWGQINDALTSMGMSPRKIGDIRLFLKKQK